MQPFHGLGMWVWEADKNDPESFCARLAANHYGWVAVKAHDGGNAFNSAASLHAWHNACVHHGLRFGVWGYCTGDAQVDAHLAAQAVKTFSADFYIADIETEYEQAQGPASRTFCEEFRKRLGNHPAAISSFGRIDYHSGIDFKAWHDHGFDFMPQAYECESTALSPQLCVNTARQIWDNSRIFPTLGTYAGARGILSGQQLHDSVVHIPLPGVNIWDAQELHGDQLEKLGTLAHASRPQPTPQPKPRPNPQPKWPSWDGVNPHRALKLTSPLTRGPDVQHLQQAINDRSFGAHVAIDGEYGPITEHMTGVTAFTLGLLDTTASIDTQKLVEYPWHRNPNQHRRAKQRADAAAKAKQNAKGKMGLEALPGIAAHYIGVQENPADSNSGHPYPSGWEAHFGIDYQPWCGAFAGSVVLAGGGHVTDRVVFCPYIVADAHSKTNGFDMWVDNHDQGVGPGWLVLYDWDGDGVADHVGVVESIHPDHLVAIEGNTGGTNPSAGGMVARVTRGYGPTLGYARPRI